MNPNSMESNNYPTKEESTNTSHDTKTSRASSSSNNPTPWLKSKDPRIVRVSRALGTKDRHSKVCTVRGLRDRRVRLSVPTAIQLYDLQDRLGLNQPSKVFDWLIDNSKEAIDDLPPLQIPQGLNHHSFLPSHAAPNSNNEIDWEDQTGLARLNLWNSRSKLKDIVGETSLNDEEKQQVSSSTNFFPRNNNNNINSSTSLQGLLNSVLPYGGSYYQLEPSSNFNFSQLGGHHGIMTSSSSSHHHGQGDHHHQQELQNFNVLVCPPQGSATTQPYFPEFDPRQMSHFHMLSSTTSSSSSQNPFTTFQLGMNPNNHIDDSRNDAPNKGT